MTQNLNIDILKIDDDFKKMYINFLSLVIKHTDIKLEENLI